MIFFGCDLVGGSLFFLILSQVREVVSYYVFKYIPFPFLSSPSGTPIMQMSRCLVSYKCLKLSSLFLFFFCSISLISTTPVFQLTCSSLWSNLLLIPSSIFFFLSVTAFLSSIWSFHILELFVKNFYILNLYTSNLFPISLTIFRINYLELLIW